MGKRTKALTEKQHAFALKVAAEHCSYTEAYRQVYGGSNMSPVTINKKASLLARRPEVATVIGGVRGEAEAAAAEKLGYTIADSMALADEAFAAGRAAGQTGTMVSAATLKAKLAGHLVERKEVRSGPLEDADIQDLLLMRKRLAEERADEQAAQELLGEAPAQPQEQDGNRPIKRTLQ